MKFDELDKQLRVYETAADTCVLPGMYMVARIDGRNFTRLTKDVHKFDAPFDDTSNQLVRDVCDSDQGDLKEETRHGPLGQWNLRQIPSNGVCE